ncbi:MAG: mycothiol system anti-sigma-R factor [Actinomycetota bacterium]
MNDPDCVKLVGQLYELLDGEIGQRQVEFLQTHLEECGDCLMRLGVEAHFTRLVRERCSGGDCPDEVVLRIKRSLHAEIIHLS